MSNSMKLLLLAAASILLSGSRVQGQTTSEMLVRDTTDRFMKSIKEEDLEGMIQRVSFPFYFDGKHVLEKDTELRALFQKPFDQRDYSDLTWKIVKVESLEKVELALNEEQRKQLETVTRAGDVFVQIEATQNGRSDGLALIARVAEGKASIVGLSD